MGLASIATFNTYIIPYSEPFVKGIIPIMIKNLQGKSDEDTHQHENESDGYPLVQGVQPAMHLTVILLPIKDHIQFSLHPYHTFFLIIHL